MDRRRRRLAMARPCALRPGRRRRVPRGAAERDGGGRPGALAASTGSPSWWLIIPVAALGAVVGDTLCYFIGRTVGLDRWRWQGEGRVGTAILRVRRAVHQRTAVLVFTARYVPFARIAVNLAAAPDVCRSGDTFPYLPRRDWPGPVTTSRSGRSSAAPSPRTRCSAWLSRSRSPSCSDSSWIASSRDGRAEVIQGGP